MDFEKCEWAGDPVLYTRPGGHGLVVGKYQYLLKEDGTLESASRVSQPVLSLLVKNLFPGSSTAPGAYIKTYTVSSPIDKNKETTDE